MFFATVAILLILMHVRSVFVVVLTLPLSVLIAFILMHVFNISSNIMSLSGIAISIGILVDQAIVMLENATHRLTQHFGDRKITGDTTDIVAAACRQVGRPIFFSVVIMVISFLPVFALTGQEGKMFHPLAFTKTFALIGTAIVSVTLVRHSYRSWSGPPLPQGEQRIIRSVIEMYRPVLTFDARPKTVIWLFVVLPPPCRAAWVVIMPRWTSSIWTYPSRHRGSVTEVTDDLKVRDALLRSCPK